MRLRTVKHGQMPPGARHGDVKMMEKLFEPRIAIHGGTAANEPIDHAVG